jgi:hypothetical protein
MGTKRVWFLLQVTSVVAGAIGTAMPSVYAAEAPFPADFERSTFERSTIPAESPEFSTAPQDGHSDSIFLERSNDTIAEEIAFQPVAIDFSLSEIGERPTETADLIFQTWTENELSNRFDNEPNNSEITIVDSIQLSEEHESINDNQPSNEISLNSPQNLSELPELEPLTAITAQDLSQNDPAQYTFSELSEASMISATFHSTDIQLAPIVFSDFEQSPLEHWQIAQVAPSPAPDDSETPEVPVPEAVTPSSPRWQFSVIPYGFVPFSVSGSATVRNFTADIDLGLDDLLDSLSALNFAAAGRLEAWRGNLGFVFDGSYLNVGQENTTSRSIPDCLCNIFPSEITTDVNVQYGQFDLGVGYRAAANTANATNDFELGPLVFDAIVGVRIYAFQQEIDISTNVDTGRSLERSSTIVTPMASGRLRWNLSPNIAGWVRGDVAGFGLGGTLMAVSVTGGLDWMFSGNTSLLLAYRISSLQYTTDVRGEDFELDLLMQGPYMGIVFRF